MIYIKKVHIEGFKKFRKIDIEFNSNKNLLVGDNGSGKTTVLEAIDLALNHSVKNFDLSLLQLLFNIDDKNDFENNPSTSTLPKIIIDVFFGCTNNELINPNYEPFYGLNYGDCRGNEDYGVEFRAEFDKTVEIELIEQIKNKNIPFEFYTLSSKTFGNTPYRPGLSKISFYFINSTNSMFPNLNSYSKMMFKSLDNNVQVNMKNSFSIGLKKAILDTMGLLPSESPKFSNNINKTSLENILEIYENDLPVSMLGQGNESIIKTRSMIKNHSKCTILGIEEPENHLSYSTMNEMISLIQQENDKQLIITSHSNRIASNFGLNNVIGLSKNTNNIITLKDLKQETYEYFETLPSDSMLQFILSKKVILVEGPAELAYMNLFYRKLFNCDMEKNGIACISVNGLAFKHYIQIAKIMDIRLCVITDNDNDLTHVKNYEKEMKEIYNSSKFALFTDPDENRRTFEICLYQDNIDLIKKALKLKEGSSYDHKYANGDKFLGKMLNDKTGTAIDIIKYINDKDNPAIDELIVPNYIIEALNFINE